MLAYDLVELDDVVGSVGDDRQAQLVRHLSRRAQKIETARLDFTRGQEPAHTPVHAAVDPADAGKRALELFHTRHLVHDPREPPLLVAHPATRVVAGAEVGAQAEAVDLAE